MNRNKDSFRKLKRSIGLDRFLCAAIRHPPGTWSCWIDRELAGDSRQIATAKGTNDYSIPKTLVAQASQTPSDSAIQAWLSWKLATWQEKEERMGRKM
ncbi:hypothetical protein BDDG_07161 [Blastomyces dermatitidis ATCC 18188]|uniref:Uncharacterized protein n=1 Tax=Ajellomyces dermatitidis (strain ATCC 18188 / CBS 674.68) TaxID=653446 RepID=F2TLV3_AJEDA|nr:hypothetical protein BDDG_07161 [Blastomyces dermatitidis ATCC 18188]EQL30834.1 hypothetical protein BDFG_06711 [Blastomyces dermatitidis ATCC 26199]